MKEKMKERGGKVVRGIGHRGKDRRGKKKSNTAMIKSEVTYKINIVKHFNSCI